MPIRGEDTKLDVFDRKILRAVQQTCRLSAEELGAVARLSPSAALRRLNRLRSIGVIKAEVAIIDPAAVNRPLLMIVGVTLEGDDAKAVANFTRKMQNTPAVVQCYFVTGQFDYIVVYAAKDMAEFDRFIQSELIADPCVSASSTSVVIRPVKVGLAIPVDEEGA